jgi:uncharacterized protein
MRLRANSATASLWVVVSALSIGGASAQVIPGGPTFDCSRARSCVERALCSNRAAANADWEYSAARWAYFFAILESQRTGFERNEREWQLGIDQQCRLQWYRDQTISWVTNSYSNRAQQLKITTERRCFGRSKAYSRRTHLNARSA